MYLGKSQNTELLTYKYSSLRIMGLITDTPPQNHLLQACLRAIASVVGSRSLVVNIRCNSRQFVSIDMQTTYLLLNDFSMLHLECG
jgi:hypothetical protein